MLKCVYMFESDGAPSSGVQQTISTSANTAIAAGINERPGVHFQELTDPANPKPLFAVFFGDSAQQEIFERLFDAAIKLCGLRVSVLRSYQAEGDAAGIPSETRRAELGYFDRARGFALFIPTVRGSLEDA